MNRIFPANCGFSLYLSAELHSKANVLSMTMKNLHHDKSYTISRLYDTALYEYFQNHKDEIIKMLDEYHGEGCGQKFMEDLNE